LKVSKAEEEDVDPTEYSKVIDCLRYLLQTQPDLAFSVGVASRYMQNPKASHAKVIKQILIYVKGSKEQSVLESCMIEERGCCMVFG